MRDIDINAPESSVLTPEELQKVLSSIDIPVCPAVVMQALNETRKDEPDLRVLVDLLASDPSMAAAALKYANSPLMRRGNPLTSTRQAVERLGINAVANIVVVGALRSSVEGLPAAWLNEFWQRSTQVAEVATLVARRQFGVSQDAAYTYALFHNAAIPMMMKRFADYGEVMEAARASGELLVPAEAQHFHCTHPVVGSLMVRNWGLPPTLGLAIRFHHDADAYELPDQTLPGSALSLIAVTHVAEHLVARIRDENDYEVGQRLFEKALAFMGISDAELDELQQRVETALEER